MIALEKSVDTTYQPKALDFGNDRPAIFRTGSDIGLPAHVDSDRFCKLVGSAPHSTTLLITTASDGWLKAIIEAVSEYRNLANGWDGHDGLPPEARALDAAEMLAVLASAYPKSEFLTFSVDALGRPTFAGRTRDFYVHLTIDDSNHITWFAEKDGAEYFEGDVEFQGRKIPFGLSEILA